MDQFRLVSLLPLIILTLPFLFFPVHSASNRLKFSAAPEPDFGITQIRRSLTRVRKHTIKTIQSPDGDIIDCVLKEHQPAFHHPLLKKSKIKDPPPTIPRHHKFASKSEVSAVSAVSEKPMQLPKKSRKVIHQQWQINGSCPDGTIPIRRTSAEHILRSRAVKKNAPIRKHKQALKDDLVPGLDFTEHEYAVAELLGTDIYYGVAATLSVWDPEVELPSEFSLSQIWLSAGSYENDDLNTLEAGWQVSEGLYDDASPRFFIYWTRDAYESTGCYNVGGCSGFVQLSNKVAIGGSIMPVSSQNGLQIELDMLIYKDQTKEGGDWWLNLGDEVIGYWPAELFTTLNDAATSVQFGGEIINAKNNGMHTTTQMGSGAFAEQGFGKASYFKNIRYVNSDNALLPVASADLNATSTNPTCYTIQVVDPDLDSDPDFGPAPAPAPADPNLAPVDSDPGSDLEPDPDPDNGPGATFLYGGPGQNELCQ